MAIRWIWWAALLSGAARSVAEEWPQPGLAAAATPAVQPAVLAETPATLESVLSAHDAARGGKRSWNKVKTVRFSGSLTMGALAIPFVMDVARPGKLRMEMQVQGSTALQIYDGKQGWTLTPSLGQSWVQPVSGEDLRALASQGDIDGHLIDYAEKGYGASFLGPSRIGEIAVYGITLKRKDDGAEETHFLDASTFLPLKLEAQTRVQAQPVRTDVRFSDFRTVEGRVVPFAMVNVVTTVNGPVSQELKLEKVEFNVRFPRGHFDQPVAPP